MDETPVLCGLPDDLALLCLVRVPRTYHGNLRCVSKRWRDLVCSKEWHIMRKKYNLEETWIYALCVDRFCQKCYIPIYSCYVLDLNASRRCWKRIQDLPPSIVKREMMQFEVLGNKAYLIGGCNFRERHEDLEDDLDNDRPLGVADEVYCYDAMTNSWSEVAPLSTPRYHFASEVLDGKIYAIGSELNEDGKDTWETYDPATNIWTAKSDPDVVGTCDVSMLLNGKLHAWDSRNKKNPRAAFYDPATATWHDGDNNLVAGLQGGAAVAGGRLYSVVSSGSVEESMFMVWEEDMKKWVMAADLSSFLEQLFYCVVGTGNSLYFIGEGLVTAEVDVTSVGNGGEALISQITGPISKCKPMLCKCMTI